MPGSPVLTRMSSRPCAGITGSNQSVTPDLFRGHRFLPAPFFSMFASRSDLHTHTFTSFECSLCKSVPLRKETREGFQNGNAYCKKMQESGTAKALRLLVAAAFANRGHALNCRKMFFAFLVKTFRVEFEENSIWDIQSTAHLKVRCALCQNF